MNDNTPTRKPIMNYDELTALNNLGCYECPYIRNPELGVNKYTGLCSLLLSPCKHPQMFDSNSRFNLPCPVYQNFIAEQRVKIAKREKKPKIHHA